MFAASLHNGFTNWDDGAYVTENPHIRDFSIPGLTSLWATTLRTAELSLTIFSFAVDYALWQLNPFPYHLENLLLHLANILLVFFLLRKLSGQVNAALLTALFFAIHPFRVESVVWVSQRKDVLYACFYLSTLLCYAQSVTTQSKRRYLLLASWLFFCSLLAKYAAVTLVPTLLLVDYCLDRKVSHRLLLEKTPFLLILALRLWNRYLMPQTVPQLIMGSVEAVGAPEFHLLDRMFLACYALLWYLIGLFAPLRLAIIHPFPLKTGGYLPLKFYLAPLGVLLLGLLIVLLLRKISSRREVVFGTAFFLIHIAIALHLVPFGGVSVVAERYTYLASIGVFYILSHSIAQVLARHNQYPQLMKACVVLGLSLYLVFFSGATHARTRAWKNSVTLWDAQIAVYPDYALAYNNRGTARQALFQDYQGAMADFSAAIALNPQDAAAYNNRGFLKNLTGEYRRALDDLNAAIAIQPEYAEAYNNRGLVKNNIGDYQGAVADCTRAIALNQRLAHPYYNRGSAKGMLGAYRDAIEDFSAAIALEPDFAAAYSNRGLAKGMTGEYQEALEDFSTAIALAPHIARPYYYRGNLNYMSGASGKACSDWAKAAKLGDQTASASIRRYCRGSL